VIRVELAQELRAPLGLIGLSDRGRLASQSLKRPQEPSIALVLPTDIPRAPPPRVPQGVQPAVVSDAVIGVGLDRIGRHVTQRHPGIDHFGERRRYRGQRHSLLSYRRGQRVAEAPARLAGRRREDRLGNPRCKRDIRAHACHACTVQDAFCDIVAGASAQRVLDEPAAVAFLDVRPVFPGHVLVVPRRHYETLDDLPVDEIGPFFAAVQRIARAVERGLGTDGTFVGINNKVSQSVAHLHVHVVPRRRKDGLRGFFWPRHRYDSEQAMAEVAARIAAALR
jgi:histidine triad (HIT) family protein